MRAEASLAFRLRISIETDSLYVPGQITMMAPGSALSIAACTVENLALAHGPETAGAVATCMVC